MISLSRLALAVPPLLLRAPPLRALPLIAAAPSAHQRAALRVLAPAASRLRRNFRPPAVGAASSAAGAGAGAGAGRFCARGSARGAARRSVLPPGAWRKPPDAAPRVPPARPASPPCASSASAPLWPCAPKPAAATPPTPVGATFAEPRRRAVCSRRHGQGHGGFPTMSRRGPRGRGVDLLRGACAVVRAPHAFNDVMLKRPVQRGSPTCRATKLKSGIREIFLEDGGGIVQLRLLRSIAFFTMLSFAREIACARVVSNPS